MLFALATVEDMAQAWLSEQRRERPPDEDVADDDPYWWALELWWLPEWLRDVDRVRAGLLALVDAAETSHELGLIGAAHGELRVRQRR